MSKTNKIKVFKGPEFDELSGIQKHNIFKKNFFYRINPLIINKQFSLKFNNRIFHILFFNATL